MKSSFRTLFSTARIMCFLAAVVLTVATIMSFNHTPKNTPILPRPEITVFVINLLCAILCLVLVVLNGNAILQATILFIQGITCTLTGFETLGIFLYTAFVITLFINGFFKKKAKQKLISIIVIWIFVLAAYGRWCVLNFENRYIYYLLLECGLSAFFMGFYVYVYKKLELQLSPLIIATDANIATKIKLPPPGSELHLLDYGLSERQAKIVIECVQNKKSYTQVSEEQFVSNSAIKKQMHIIFKKFYVSNFGELNILLLQYILKL